MSESTEEMYIKLIQNGIRAIRLGIKEPKDTQAGMALNKLKAINLGLYEDYIEKYKKVLVEHKKRSEK